MPSEDKHSRTEKPTAKRKREARREGRVARTPELVTWVVVLAGTYLVKHTVSSTYALTQSLMLQISGAMSHPSLAVDLAVATSGGEGALRCLAPALLSIMGIAMAINLAQTRALITFHPLKPSFSKLNPVKGLKRVISPRSLWEVGKQIIRMVLLSIIAWQCVSGLMPIITGNNPLSVTAVGSLVATRAVGLAREVAEIGLVLAALDYAVQYRRTSRELRMTKQEVREESKASDGNPYMKGAIRKRQRQMARNRMIAAVAQADAVVVNPTHFAVALRYVRGRGAPKVVAKGSDFMAFHIREEATKHRVPIVEDPPLARALYVTCDLDQEIPNELFEAVARLLTFIYSLRGAGRAARIDGAPHKPAKPLLGLNDPLAHRGDRLLEMAETIESTTVL
jgi:flagellar biosynthesis protein FlhB